MIEKMIKKMILKVNLEIFNKANKLGNNHFSVLRKKVN